MTVKVKILAAFLSVLVLLPLFVFNVSPEGESNYSYPVGGVNVNPKSGTIIVYTPEYGKTTGVGDSYNAIEIAVSNYKIKSIGKTNSEIPSDGFVAVVRGNTLKSQIESLNLKEGDTAIFDNYNMEMFFINENYSPFYSNTINFDRYNSTRTENTIIIYNKGETTNTNIWGSEVVVDGEGFVASIGGNNNIIPEGGFVISAVGRERIAELTEAAALGLKVTVDDKAKTITFSFSKESITGKMTVEYNNFIASVENSKKSYAVLDYAECEAMQNLMNQTIAKAKAAMENNDIAGAMIKKYEFEGLKRQAEVLATEFPAVEERAAWLRPSNSETREKVNETVKAIYEAGFNAVCIEMLFNSVTIFPVDSEKYLFSQDPALKGFDVLKAYIDECHKYGIEIHGWMPCFRVSHGSTTNSKLAVSTLKPEWLQKAKSGTVEVGDTKGLFFNPALPEVCDFLLEFYRYILETYALDGFQLDYIRYPFATGEDFGYDDYTRNAFKEKHGTDPMELTTSSPLWNEWCKFRAAYVTDFVRRFSQMAREIRPDIYVSAAVAPDFRDMYVKYMQESEIWLTTGLIDMAFPMAYGTNVIPLYSSFTVNAAGDKAYSYIGVGDYGVDIFKRQIVETRQAGADGFAFFAWNQYVTGGYQQEIAKTILSKPALSPSYKSADALTAQMDYIMKRLDAIKYINPSAVTEELGILIKSMSANIQSAFRSFYAEDCAEIIKEAMERLTAMNLEDGVKEVLLADFSKAYKISSLSKSKAKKEYAQNHPQTEESGEESSEDISSSQSESSIPAESGGNKKSGGSSKAGLIAGLAGAGVILAVLATIIMVKRRKKK